MKTLDEFLDEIESNKYYGACDCREVREKAAKIIREMKNTLEFYASDIEYYHGHPTSSLEADGGDRAKWCKDDIHKILNENSDE